jgi:ATP-binding cassette, subfamily B, bacterial
MDKNSRQVESASNREVWRNLFALSWPLRRQFAWVALFAMLATAADLVEPLIYRVAVNDIAGLFVGAEGERGVDSILSLFNAGESDEAESGPPAAHGPGNVAARMPKQTFRTLMWAVALMFMVNTLSYWFTLLADQRTAVLASRVEADLIQRTFGHVLRLPLSFFSRRPSAGLAKQIDQLDQVSPIVTAAAYEIAPEVLTLIGVVAIMMTQDWRLTLAALVTLPSYLWIVRRSAKRLESGLETYYGMWESVSSRIQDALGAIKTVKLSGSESREASRLRGESDAAYATYIKRNRLENY